MTREERMIQLMSAAAQWAPPLIVARDDRLPRAAPQRQPTPDEWAAHVLAYADALRRAALGVEQIAPAEGPTRPDGPEAKRDAWGRHEFVATGPLGFELRCATSDTGITVQIQDACSSGRKMGLTAAQCLALARWLVPSSAPAGVSEAGRIRELEDELEKARKAFSATEGRGDRLCEENRRLNAALRQSAEVLRAVHDGRDNETTLREATIRDLEQQLQGERDRAKGAEERAETARTEMAFAQSAAKNALEEVGFADHRADAASAECGKLRSKLDSIAYVLSREQASK